MQVSLLALVIGITGLYQIAEGQTAEDGPRSLPAIKSREEFDTIARIHNPNTPYPLPHAIFVIDRKAKNRIYYVNSRRYKFHKDFINGTYLSLERGQTFFENNYIKPNRRFILGTVAYQTPIKQWTLEFWEGDQIPADLIKLAYTTVNKSFFEKVAYKPNSNRQDELSKSISGLKRILPSDISKEQEYQPLNVASGLGRIHIIDKLDDTVDIGFNEIVVLNEIPLNLPPVAGIITAQHSTPLSHINLLAKSWKIPNAYIKDAHKLFKEYDGWWVKFETTLEGYSIKRADIKELDEYQKRLLERRDLMTPKADLTNENFARLKEQRATDVVAYGAKSANLGELMNAKLPGVIVPNGFTIPFFYYDEFLKENKIEEYIYELMNDQNFIHNPSYRRGKLVELRDRIKAGTINEDLKQEVLTYARTDHPGKGLFVRSSTNSEDLPNFNGAGLYTTVPNVHKEAELIEAIKTVWASVWNYEAYEARERAGIDHVKVYMAVIIQEGINADSAGVMITTDPFDKDNQGFIYISAKRGLGIKVVEGQKIAEQLLFDPQTGAVKVLTRSTEDSLLTFDKKGGVKEIPITGVRTVLTDVMARKLARISQNIKKLFGGKDQDIEWVVMNDQIYIVQARPYVAGN
jgi:rifampicin phosphotransferase